MTVELEPYELNLLVIAARDGCRAGEPIAGWWTQARIQRLREITDRLTDTWLEQEERRLPGGGK